MASPETVRQYIEDLQEFIDSRELTERRALINSFVKGIRVIGNEGRNRYTFPVPPDSHDEEELGVLPIVRYSVRLRI